MSFPSGANSAACIMWSRVKNMIASFGRREMQKCKIEKKGEDASYFIIKYDLILKCRYGPETARFSRAIRSRRCSTTAAAEKE